MKPDQPPPSPAKHSDLPWQPSREALRVAEAICGGSPSIEFNVRGETIARLIDQHTNLKALLRIREAAEKLSKRIDLWKRGVAEGVEVQSSNNELRAALDALEGKG